MYRFFCVSNDDVTRFEQYTLDNTITIGGRTQVNRYEWMYYVKTDDTTLLVLTLAFTACTNSPVHI